MSAPKTVPFIDLSAQMPAVRAEVEQRFNKIIDTTSFILREHCDAFEEEFADYLGARHVIGVGNGTDALVVALKALGVGTGDEVITAANSYVATAEAIVLAGAAPVLVDVDADTFNLDPQLVAEAVTERTAAVIPVHLYGRPANLSPILALAERHGFVVLEDAAQAHGAVYDGRRVADIGALGCFSFYPTKNLGAFGDAGAIVTSDDSLADRARRLRDHGGLTADEHLMIAQNSRMDALQAAVLSVKLPHLDMWNAQRRQHAAGYAHRAEEHGLTDRIVLPPADHPGHVHHIYVTQVPGGRRDAVLTSLRRAGVGAGVHYPRPIHLTEAFSHLGLAGQLPVSERLAGEILSLPMYPQLTEDDLDYVIDSLAVALEEA